MSIAVAVVVLLVGAAASLVVPVYLRRERIVMDAVARIEAPGSFVRLTHGTTHYLVGGPVGGPVVVLVHGATLSSWIWDGLAERLAASGHRVLRYDLYGRGYSDRPRATYDSDLYDRQLTELLTALDITGPVHLVSLAFGAPITAKFALCHPAQVASVTLIAPDGFRVHLTRGQRLLTSRVVGTYLAQVLGSATLLRRLPDYSDDEHLVAWLRRRFEPELQVRGFKRALLSSVRSIPIHNSRKAYRSMAAAGVALQVLWGREDRVTPLPDESDLGSALPGAEITVFDHVGHLPHRENLARTTELISDFIDRHGGPPSSRTGADDHERKEQTAPWR